MVAVDGLDALEKLRQCPQPCFILSDMNMPGLDGQRLARIIREGSCPCLRIISMSATHEQPDLVLVEGHLEKPFDFDVLLPTVERFCQGPTWWVKARTGE